MPWPPPVPGALQKVPQSLQLFSSKEAWPAARHMWTQGGAGAQTRCSTLGGATAGSGTRAGPCAHGELWFVAQAP